jgi:hypothetical protein
MTSLQRASSELSADIPSFALYFWHFSEEFCAVEDPGGRSGCCKLGAHQEVRGWVIAEMHRHNADWRSAMRSPAQRLDAMSVIAGAQDPRPAATGANGYDNSEQLDEARKALEVYKKKDPSKGMVSCLFVPSRHSDKQPSGCAVQGGRKRANNEAELL